MTQFIFAWPNQAKDVLDTLPPRASVFTAILTQQKSMKATVVRGAVSPPKLGMQKLWRQGLSIYVIRVKVKVK